MNTNFFTEQFGFQKNLIDPSNDIGAKKDYTTALKKNEFKTSRSKQQNDGQNDVDASEQNKKFAEMMDALKKKDKHPPSPTKESGEVKAMPAKLFASNAQINAFHTEQAAAVIVAQPNKTDTIELSPVELSPVELSDDAPQIDLLNIASLNEEIQRLINENMLQTDSAVPKMDNTAIQLTVNAKEIAELSNDKIENIISVLATLLSNKGNDGKSNDKKDIEPNALIYIAEKIMNMSKESDATAITNGLSSEKLAQIQEYIQKYSNSDELALKDIKDLEELVSQFVTLAAPTKPAKDASLTNTQETSLHPIPAKLLASPTPKEQNTENRYDARYDMKYDARYDMKYDARYGNSNSDKGDFKAELKDVAIKDAGINAAKTQGSNNGQSNNGQSAGQNFLQMTALAQGNNIIIDGSAQQNITLTALQNAQSPLQSSLTNVITQSQNAGTNHPATQMVSATIQKALKAGENTNIKLRLDPPELGRVEVKMSIDKDNVTKIVLTAEKSETYMLLKQDTDILQRALSNAGLDADGNLSFELADDGHDFNDGRKNNNNQSERRQNNNSTDDNLIETSLDWQLDPQTGRMRYNALV